MKTCDTCKFNSKCDCRECKNIYFRLYKYEDDNIPQEIVCDCDMASSCSSLYIYYYDEIT
jgi:hypothetical protein